MSFQHLATLLSFDINSPGYVSGHKGKVKYNKQMLGLSFYLSLVTETDLKKACKIDDQLCLKKKKKNLSIRTNILPEKCSSQTKKKKKRVP